ncbi:hypothetical protein DV738_g727, partial [Chaetothyriales sp. CBS 135597]
MFATALYALISSAIVPVYASGEGRAAAAGYQRPILSTQEQTCPNPQLSCPTTTTPNVDTCCVNSPGGIFLQTQFWDTSPSLGPADSWTIHGLWPDLCNGGYEASCDSSRDVTDIQAALLSASSSASELVDFMSEYWLSLNGDNNHLWSHEWNKHGTCVSTLEPACYGDGDGDGNTSSSNTTSRKDVLDYFTRTVELYRTRNTYDALASANIVPSTEHTYALRDLQAALAPLQSGANVTIRCDGREFREVWYYFRVRGPLRNAPTFSASLKKEEIADDGEYGSGSGGGDSIFIPAEPDNSSKSNSFTLASRYAPCAFIPPVYQRGGGLFLCERKLGIQSLFTSCKSGLYKLQYLDQTTFFADKIPDKWDKVGIYSDDKGGERTVQVEIVWQSL